MIGTDGASSPEPADGCAPGRREASAGDVAWARPSRRMVVLVLARPSAQVLLVAAVLALGGVGGVGRLVTAALAGLSYLLVVTARLGGTLSTRYRVTDERIEVRSGVLGRRVVSLPLHRIRGAEVTEGPLHRVLGLACLRLDTTAQGGAGDTKRLDGLTPSTAREVRARLVAQGKAAPIAPLCALDPAWVRYAPLTLWGPLTLIIAVNSADRILRNLQVDPLRFPVVRDLVALTARLPLWCTVVLGLAVVVVAGSAWSVARFVEGWHRYRLEWSEEGDLRVRRGLLVKRVVTVDRRRIQGVELLEPVLLRWAGGARLTAVAGGMTGREDNRERLALTPAVPAGVAGELSATVLGQARPPTAAALTAHPPRASRRRVVMAASTAVLVAAVPIGLSRWLGPALGWTGLVLALTLLPLSVLVARECGRSLGHQLVGPYLVTRSGFNRRTVALRRAGIVGWTISRSVFQRRAGLLNVAALTSGGNGVYSVRDVGEQDGLRLAREAAPGILDQFLVTGPTEPATGREAPRVCPGAEKE